jgi:hypothetical protein
LIVVFQFSPLSHLVRLSVLTWSQVRGTGPVGGAISYGAISFAFQSLAAWATILLVLHPRPIPERGGRLRRRASEARDRLEAWVAARHSVRKISLVPVAVLGGSPAAVWLWHVSSPGSGRKAHFRFGFVVALALGVFSAVQGALVGWGLGASLPALLLVMAVGAAVLVWLLVASRARRSDRDVPR